MKMVVEVRQGLKKEFMLRGHHDRSNMCMPGIDVPISWDGGSCFPRTTYVV